MVIPIAKSLKIKSKEIYFHSIVYYIDSFFSFALMQKKQKIKEKTPIAIGALFFPGQRTKTPIILKVFIGFVVGCARRCIMIWMAPKGTVFRLVSSYSNMSL